jgi:hypothetical protein
VKVAVPMNINCGLTAIILIPMFWPLTKVAFMGSPGYGNGIGSYRP